MTGIAAFAAWGLAVAAVGSAGGAALAQDGVGQTGANWAQWRGPFFNGSSPAKDLPDKLDKDRPLWVTRMPGHSNGTAIVCGERVFTSASEPGSLKLMAVCLSRADGKILWQKEVGQAPGKNPQNDYATPSPVTDGKRVVFLYAQGDIVCFDYDGKEVWKRNLWADHGQWNMLWIYGASPLWYKGKLYIPVLHRDVAARGLQGPRAGDSLADSYLLALDPETGKDLWKVVRPTDAVVESRESYATPIPWERPERTEILVAGGDCITGHDPATGRELWRYGGWNPEKIPHWRLVPSAVTFENLVYVCPPKGGKMRAVRGGGAGDVTATHQAWMSDDLSYDVTVPLVYKGNLYVLDEGKRRLSCADPKTGNIKWAGTLDARGVFRGSPTGADGKVYCTNEAGDVYVVAAEGPEFKLLSKASLGSEDKTRASVSVVDGMVVVRTGDRVWAFGKR